MKNLTVVLSLLMLVAIVLFGCSKASFEEEQIIPEVKIDTVYVIDYSDNINIINNIVVLDDEVLHSIALLASFEIDFVKIGVIDKSEKRPDIQGCCIYDGIMFQCYHTNEIIDLISVDSLKRKASILLESNTIIHCNDVSFGGRKYQESDHFPVLYIQQRGYASTVNAYRIWKNQDFYDASLIQSIVFSPCNYSVSTIDAKRSLFYVLYDNGDGTILSSYDIPAFNKTTTDVNLLKEAKNKSFFMPLTKVTQDMAFFDHYLFISSGYSGEGELWIVDVNTSMARRIDLPSYGIKAEPEGLSFYQGKLYLVMNNYNCYTLDISSLFE